MRKSLIRVSLAVSFLSVWKPSSIFHYHFVDSTLRQSVLSAVDQVKTHSLIIMLIFSAESVSYFPWGNRTNAAAGVVSCKGLAKYCFKSSTARHQTCSERTEGNNVCNLNIRIHSFAYKGVCRVNVRTLMMKAISGLQRVLVLKGAGGKGLPGIRVYFHVDLAARLHFLLH